MKKIFILAALALAAAPMAAQETYENANIATGDLNGTARYVGMGGAMEALGADISTIGTNPAGIGLFRRSAVSVSFGGVSQQDGKDFANGDKTNMSFDQIGFVYAHRSNDGTSFLNFGFNYHKSRNFDYILSAAGNHQNRASQNALSYIKAIGPDDAQTGESTFAISEDKYGLYGSTYYTSQLDNLYYNNFIFDRDGVAGYNFANQYELNRAMKGHISQYDFNLSANVNDRVYLGLTFGVSNVWYKGYGEYTEALVDRNDAAAGRLTVCDERKVKGEGFDVKAGVIFRPVEESPFRIGLSIASPTWYDLRTENYTYLRNETTVKGYNEGYETAERYDFKLYTPWRFGLSVGHTVGNYLALGASYEFADYGSLDSRENTGGTYDWYTDSYYESSESDKAMKEHTKHTLKGVSTLKLGAELKADEHFAVRLGYNYVSPMYKSAAYKDGSVDSYGSNYATATDYVNWKATNRITCGIGYATGNFNFDLAYQYSATNGDFYPFMDSYGDVKYNDGNRLVTEQIDNYASAVSVKNNRHQLLLTLGYRF